MARCLRCGTLRGCSVGLGADGGRRSRFFGSDICQSDLECMFNAKKGCRFHANGGWNPSCQFSLRPIGNHFSTVCKPVTHVVFNRSHSTQSNVPFADTPGADDFASACVSVRASFLLVSVATGWVTEYTCLME